MKRKSLIFSKNTIILVFFIYLQFADNFILAEDPNTNELRPPIQTDKNKQSTDRLSHISGENTRKSNSFEDTSSQEEQNNSDDYSFTTNSAIKIVKAPDLNKESENGDEKFKEEAARQAKDLYDQLVKDNYDSNSFEETDLLDDHDTLQRELTPDELEAERLYQSAMAILNKTRGDKEIGHSVLADAARHGHVIARVKIAWAQLLGHHPIPLNIEAAKTTFTELAAKGLPDAHMGLGFMYASGIGQNVSQAKAILHYTFAALGDNTWAQMAMGYRYWGGIGVPNSCEQALEFYQRVAKKVASEVTFSGGTALNRIRLLDEVENSGSSSGILDNDLIDYYQLLADKGDVQAQVGLGQLHYQGGRGVPLDHQKALHYFQQAANAGNAIAMAFLGKMYLEGSEHIKADNDTAFKYFKRAADLGNPVGQSGLGVMYLQGKGVLKDTVKAFNFFTKAAEQGWVDGQLQLGNMYFTGTGVKRDFKQANKYFSLASQAGHVLAFYNLGQIHAAGLGTMRSCLTAVELFKSVAERGKWIERLMFAYQDYRSYRFEEAFMQYALMSELGYEVAQSNAAFLLDKGEINLFKSRKEDLIRALQYWGRAAAQGYSPAQVKLGDYHYYGLGTNIDYETAASHYRMASDQQHNAQAMFNLGYMHEQGLGMKQDIHLAKRCYDLAAETSDDAKVPVAMALLKLHLLFKLESLKDSPFQILLHLDENITSNWDLYLITILTLFLGMIIYFRRPTPPELNNQNNNNDDNDNEIVNPESQDAPSSNRLQQQHPNNNND
uniref:CSON002933 protein n=1 Tax=Culicoides sonorensis TaxID=179676 RepID=A0A336JY00_CULSO